MKLTKLITAISQSLKQKRKLKVIIVKKIWTFRFIIANLSNQTYVILINDSYKTCKLLITRSVLTNRCVIGFGRMLTVF